MMQFFAAALPALIVASSNNPLLITTLFIVFGQGHFVITYLYQWRAKLITKQYIILYLLIGSGVFWFINEATSAVILLVTSIIFSVHYYFDEARILAGNNTSISFLLLAPSIAVFNSYLLFEKFQFDIFIPVLAVSIILLGVALYRFGARTVIRKDVVCTQLSTLILTFIYLANFPVPSEVILGVIIIHHYCTWYIYQYLKLRNDVSRLGTYVTDVLVINVLIISGFVLYTGGVGQNLLQYFYFPEYFYGWTILHIIFTAPTLLTVLKSRFQTLTFR